MQVQYFEPFSLMKPIKLNYPAQTIFKKVYGEIALEPKIDGYRVVLHKHEDKVKIFSGGGKDVTARLPEIAKSTKNFWEDIILDGEVIGLDSYGRPSYNLTQKRFWGIKKGLKLIVFDILKLNDVDLFKDDFLIRRDDLEQFHFKKNIELIPQTKTSDAGKVLEYYCQLVKQGQEGMMVKMLDRPYFFRRSYAIKKLKPVQTIDLKAASKQLSKSKGFVYDLNAKEGLLCRIYSFKEVDIGSVVEVAFEGTFLSKNYPMGFSLRHPTFFRERYDKTEPNSIEVIE